MLPTGHIAGGYLAAKAIAGLFGERLPELQNPEIIAFGVFMAFAPDLDFFYKFYKVKQFYLNEASDTRDNTHRQFLTHAPLLYLLAGGLGLAYGLWQNVPALAALAVMFVVGSWSHFLLDSSGYGIKWFWPFSKELYSFYGPNSERALPGRSFFQYWRDFLKYYATRPEPYLEVIIILIALVVAF